MHAAGLHLKGDLVENRRAPERQANIRKFQSRPQNLWE
jgi:hypothetical protein